MYESSSRLVLFAGAALLVVLASSRCDSTSSTAPCANHDDCPSDQRCNRATGLCYPGARPTDDGGGGGDGDGGGDAAAAKPGVKGQLKCRYFAQLDTTYTSSEAGMQRPDLPLHYDGMTFAMHFACAVWPDSGYVWLNFFGIEITTAKPVPERARAELVIYIRTEDYKVGELAIPSRALGWLQVAPGENKQAVTVAAVWGGRVALGAVTQTAGSDVSGDLDVELVPFVNKPFGSECALNQTYASGTKPRQALLLSPDCTSTTDCYPYLDGSAKGYCSLVCLADGECQAIEKDSRCIRGTSSGVCLHTCTGDAACKAINAAAICHPQESVCYVP